MAAFCYYPKTESPEMPGYREVRERLSVPLAHLGPFVYGGPDMNSPHYKLGQLALTHPEIDGFPLAEYLDSNYSQ